MRIIGQTDTGLIRKTNQDDYASGILPEGAAWAVVCDGMGGANGGNVASSTAVRVISRALSEALAQSPGRDDAQELLSSAVNEANRTVFEMAHGDPALTGMGTTVVACVIPARREPGAPQTAVIAHAGDSRAYRIDSDGIFQLTRDHSIVQEMLESGELTPDEAKTHPQKNIITRALGVDETLDIDFSSAVLDGEKAVLICTDGLTNHVDPDSIEAAVRRVGYELAADELIRLANENGGSDNITVVVVFE